MNSNSISRSVSRRIWFPLSVLMYVVVVIAVAWGAYRYSRSRISGGIDHKLMTGVSGVDILLPRDYPDRFLEEVTTDGDEELQFIREELTEYAQRGNFEYLGVAIPTENRLYIITNFHDDVREQQATVDHLTNVLSDPNFLSHNAGELTLDNKNQGGVCERIQPFQTSSGKNYYIFSATDISHSSFLARGPLIASFSAAGILILSGMPMLIIFIVSMRRKQRFLEATNRQISLQETKHRVLFESSQDAIIVYHPLQGYLDCNPAALSMFRITDKAELCSLNTADIWADEQPGKIDNQTLLDILNHNRLEELPSIMEWTHRRLDGELFESSVQLSPIIWENDEALMVTIRDISDAKRAEHQLRESEELYRTLVQNVDLGINLISKDFEILGINKKCQSLFHKPPGEILGRKCYEEFEKKNAVCSGCPGKIAIEQGKPAELVSRGIRDDGTSFSARIQAFPIRGTDNQVTSFVEVVEDITEQMEAEDALQKSEEMFRLVTETIDDVFWLDAPGRKGPSYVSPSYERIWGRSRKHLKDHPRDWLNAVVAEDRSVVIEKTDIAYREQVPYSIEYRIIHPKKGIRWIYERGFPVKKTDAQDVMFAGVCSDITERKAMEQQKSSLEEQLRQSQKLEAVGRLAGGVAHDFNNLMTAILGNVEICKEDMDLLDGNKLFLEESLDEISLGAQRAATLTRQLLAFSRRQIVRPKKINLNGVIADLNPMLNRLIPENIRLMIHDASDLKSIMADTGQVEQIIVNLTVNAVDALPTGGTIDIQTSNQRLDEYYTASNDQLEPGDYVQLSVRDNGIGMSDEVIEHIFEPFFTTKEPEKGSGLGLATVHGIVTQAKGHIEVYSKTNQGSNFTIFFPACPDPEISDSQQKELDRPLTGTETLLLCEDDDAIRELTAKALRMYGYTVISAPNGKLALSAINDFQGTLDMLISDVVMPEMNGRILTESLQTKFPDLKILYISGYPSDILIDQGISATGIEYLEKPFARVQLLTRLREILDA